MNSITVEFRDYSFTDSPILMAYYIDGEEVANVTYSEDTELFTAQFSPKYQDIYSEVESFEFADHASSFIESYIEEFYEKFDIAVEMAFPDDEEDDDDFIN